jgi:hypothetical protein
VPILPDDARFLAERGLQPDVVDEGGMTCLVFRDWPLGAGYTASISDLLVRLPAGFPDVAPDMWWFDPPVQRVDRAVIPQTQHTERYLGRSWQRWSRHFTAGHWKSGVDCLETFLALIRRELETCSGRTVA